MPLNLLSGRAPADAFVDLFSFSDPRLIAAFCILIKAHTISKV